MGEANKVIFLDLDGVLATRRAWSNLPEGYDRKEGIPGEFHAPVIAMFEKWLEENPDVDIVLSSTWRLGKPNTRYPYMYWKNRIGKESKILVSRIIDVTRSDLPGDRRDEILEWVSRHNVERYVVIDDDSFEFTGTDVEPFFVNTHGSIGLTRADLQNVSSLLSGE